MEMPGRVWSTLLVSFFIGWCGGERAAINQSVVSESATQQAQAVKVSLDFIPMTDPVSTFVSIKPDEHRRTLEGFARKS
jgi:hypothetical protein